MPMSVFTPWRVERGAYVWIFDARGNVILKWHEGEKPDALQLAEHIVTAVNERAETIRDNINASRNGDWSDG